MTDFVDGSYRVRRELVAKLMKHKGYTIGSLARDAVISQRSLKRMFAGGKLRMSTIEPLATKLEITPDKIIDQDDALVTDQPIFCFRFSFEIDVPYSSFREDEDVAPLLEQIGHKIQQMGALVIESTHRGSVVVICLATNAEDVKQFFSLVLDGSFSEMKISKPQLLNNVDVPDHNIGARRRTVVQRSLTEDYSAALQRQSNSTTSTWTTIWSNDVYRLREQSASLSEFADSLLTHLAAVSHAHGVVLWHITEACGLQPFRQLNVEVRDLNPDEAAREAHERLVEHVFRSRQVRVVLPYCDLAQVPGFENPTGFTILFGMIGLDGGEKGLLEVFLNEADELQIEQGIELLNVVGDITANIVDDHDQSQILPPVNEVAAITALDRAIFPSLNADYVCIALVNAGRNFIGCDRVSVATWNGRRCEIRAISGRDTFNSRSMLVQRMTDLATHVAHYGEEIWYEGSGINLPPQLEALLTQYSEAAHCESLGMYPLKCLRSDFPSQSNAFLGVLIVELLAVDNSPHLRNHIQLVVEHGSLALANVRAHELAMSKRESIIVGILCAIAGATIGAVLTATSGACVGGVVAGVLGTCYGRPIASLTRGNRMSFR